MSQSKTELLINEQKEVFAELTEVNSKLVAAYTKRNPAYSTLEEIRFKKLQSSSQEEIEICEQKQIEAEKCISEIENNIDELTSQQKELLSKLNTLALELHHYSNYK